MCWACENDCWDDKPMGDDAERAEAEWYEMGCPTDIEIYEDILGNYEEWSLKALAAKHFSPSLDYTIDYWRRKQQQEAFDRNHSTQEDRMTPSIEAKKRAFEEAIEELQLKLSQLKKYPMENPFEEGTVIRFTRYFPGGKKMFVYVGIFAANKFYLSSNQVPPMTYDELIAWLGSYTWKIEEATGWETVVE